MLDSHFRNCQNSKLKKNIQQKDMLTPVNVSTWQSLTFASYSSVATKTVIGLEAVHIRLQHLSLEKAIRKHQNFV